MKQIKTVDAQGTILCHDITQIIRGVKKDTVFRKGHIVTKEDIPILLSVGKDHLYVWEKEEGILHENDAADILRELCMNENMHAGGVKEGKIELIADCDGLFKVDKKGLQAVNHAGEMMLATRHENFQVKKGDTLAGMRIIPLVISEKKMQQTRELVWEATGHKPILELKPFVPQKVGVITTGNEVYYGRIEDTFTPVIKEKLRAYETDIIAHEILADDAAKVTEKILQMIEAGVDLVICTGGMSVDPDDRTPLAIKNTQAEIISYGAPVLPGAMFLLAYYHKTNGKAVPIIGLPGCVMYAKRTIFDLVLPRILAEDRISREELEDLGMGGLCLNCQVCTFPQCGFGK